MKSFILLLLTSIGALSAFAQEIHLDKVGKPVYRKQTDNDLGIVVYKNGTKSVATILPREYFVLGDYNDTLELIILKNKSSRSGYTASCTNCTNIRFEQLETKSGSQFILRDGKDYVLFNINYEQAPSDLRLAPQETTLPRDKEIGFIRLQNTLIHYSDFPGKPEYKIAIADMNQNGRADTSDYISLSTDEFFFTARRDRSKKIAEVKTIEIDNDQYAYSINNAGDFKLTLTPLKEHSNPDLFIQKELENLDFSGRKLYAILDSAKYVVISHWTEFSKPCTLLLPVLIELNETIPVVGIHTGNKDLQYINKRYGISFMSVQSDELLENKLNLRGYPHYIVIGENREILLDTGEIEELTSFFEK